MPHRPNSALTALADRLIIRHLRVSVPNTRMRNDLQKERLPDPLLQKQMRCIAVIGASASAPLMKRGDALATQLEKRFRDQDDARRAELFRLQRVYKLDGDDFETRLAALSRTPEITQEVKGMIAEWYAYRHPTILGYELLAHLLKHRFLDAIVSFNFDELLDQSLDDELGSDGYRRLVSDRDCIDVETDPDSLDYLPLYVKLHGTATEPDSLRLTREAYYKLPQKLMEVVQELLTSQFAAVVNVGSAMTGFDLHRLLRIPEELEIYDLSPYSVDETVRDEISSERKDPRQDSLHENERRDAATFFLPADERSHRNPRRSCDQWLKDLVLEIEYRSGEKAAPKSLASLVKFRSIDRHEAVADILGPESTLSRWTEDPKKWQADYVDYLRKRTIIELAFSGAKARGLAQLSWLATDRSGIYYELYRKAGGKEGWNTLRSSAGLDENQWLPDVVESQPHLCDSEAGPTLDEQGEWSLREFVPRSLSRHVAAHIGKAHEGERALANTLRKLQEGSEVEIQATDDRVCAKAFDSPMTLPTVTSLRVFSLSLFKDLAPIDEIYISCETGEWLLSDEEMLDVIRGQENVEVLTAFDFKSEPLKKRFGDRLSIHHIDPWRHNRHMTIVCKGNVPMRAIYFARRLRTPMITPVYLSQPADAARVKRTFDLMRAEIPRPSGDPVA